MKESLYVEATERAWHFVWRHKVLWLFGIFAAFLGQFGMVDFLSKVGIIRGGADRYFGAFFGGFGRLGKFAATVGSTFSSQLLLVFLAILLLVLLTLLIFTAVSAQGSLIHSVFQAEKKNKVDVGRAWAAGTANFWRLFILNFLRKASFVFISVSVGLFAVNALARPSVTSSIIFILSFSALAVLGLMVSFLFFYAAAYVIIGKFSVLTALGRAYKLFSGHWLVSFEIGLVVLVLNLFLGLITALVFALLLLPAILIWFAIVVVGGGNYFALASVFMAALIFFTMYLMLVGAGFTVFTSYIWTYAFLKMEKHGLKSKVLDWLHSWKK